MQPDGELSDRSKPGVQSVDAADSPKPILLVSSRDDQAQFADRPLPAYAVTLERAAEAAGWSYHHLWSLVAVPAGHRPTNRHKIVEHGHLLYVVGIRLAAWDSRAWAVWYDPGGFSSAAVRGKWTAMREIGIKELIKYVKGE